MLSCYWWRVESCGKIWGGKEDELSVVNWGFSEACSLGFFWIFFHVGDTDAPFLWVQGRYPLHEHHTSCFREEGQGEGQRDLAASAICPNSFSLKYSACQGALLEYHVPNPINSTHHTTFPAKEKNLNFIQCTLRSFKRGMAESDLHFRMVILIAR